MAEARGRARWTRNISAKIAAIPMIATALVVFLGGTIWTVVYSFTNSKLLPKANFVGLSQYERLWSNSRWLISIENLVFYGVMSLVFTVVMGFVLAVHNAETTYYRYLKLWLDGAGPRVLPPAPDLRGGGRT